MSEDVSLSNFVTKQLVIKDDSQDRFFEGILSVEIKDRQGEITDIDELYKALPVWMERNAPMSDTHSNRIVGRGINFEKVTVTTKNGEVLPAIKILGKIHNNTALDDYIWKQIQNGEYKGLSFGGATKANREPIVQSDGTMAYRLKDLEIYEVAVCEDPAVAFALITDINPLAKSEEVKKAYHVEKDNEELKVKCDGTECYINAEVRKADLGTPIDQDEVPKETETVVGEAKKDFFGQDEEDFPEKPEDKTKPLPTKWGKMEFEACEEHARKDPDVKNPGGYCGSIQQHVDKDTKVHAGKEEFGSTEQCISAQNKKPGIKDAEAYCGSRHNEEHGMNPNAPKHKADHQMGSTGHGNECKEGASCSEKPDLSEAGLDEIDKPTGDREYFKKDCGCRLSIEKDIHGIGQENPRGLGAYNTAVNGTGQTKEITDPARLGDPEKLENTPKKPKDPTVKTSKCKFQMAIEKYWEENKNSDNNTALHIAIKDYMDNYKEETVTQKSIDEMFDLQQYKKGFLYNLSSKAYLTRSEDEWIADATAFSASPEGLAQYGKNVEVDKTGNIVDESGNIIFINPFI